MAACKEATQACASTKEATDFEDSEALSKATLPDCTKEASEVATESGSPTTYRLGAGDVNMQLTCSGGGRAQCSDLTPA